MKLGANGKPIDLGLIPRETIDIHQGPGTDFGIAYARHVSETVAGGLLAAGVISLGAKLLPAVSSATKVPVSLYDDVTRAGSRVVNRATDVTKSQFEKNLIESGFARSMSKDGKVIILEKDGSRYVLHDRARSTGFSTADFYKPGSSSVDVKIRLEQRIP